MIKCDEPRIDGRKEMIPPVTKIPGFLSTDPVTYGSEPATRWLAGGVFVLFCGFLLLIDMILVHIMLTSPRAPVPIAIGVMLFLLALACFSGGIGALFCIGAARGLPRMTVTSTGIRISSPFGVQWAEWASLTDFVLSTTPAPRGPPLPTAKARIVGSGVSPNMRGKPEFVIRAMFRMPVATLVDDLNRLRPRTVVSGAAVEKAPPLSDPRARDIRTAGPLAKIAIMTVIIISILVAAYRIFTTMRPH